MTSKRQKRKTIPTNVNFGNLAAENDHLLSSAYYDNGDYAAIESRADRRSIIVGRTGSGKSAALRRLQERNSERVVVVTPENLSLPYITNLTVVRYLEELGVQLELFFVALWKHVLIVEVIRHRYNVTTPEIKKNFLQNMHATLGRDPGKKKALEYLDEFGERFWCPVDERVKEIADRFEQQVAQSAGVGINAKGTGFGAAIRDAHSTTQEVTREQRQRFQQIVNDTQLARLNEMIGVLDDHILRTDHNFTYIVIDDLDKNWVDDRLANLLVKCLFQAVADMLRVRNLKVLVALRTNIFRQIDYGAKSWGGQEEKYRALVIELTWSRNDLIELMEQRVDSAVHFYDLDKSMTLATFLPQNRSGRRDPIRYILDRTLLRPRDVISFMNRCLRLCGKRQVSWDEIAAAEAEYSDDRLAALRDEWKNPYGGIEELLYCFAGEPRVMTAQRFREIVDKRIVESLESTSRLPDPWWKEIIRPFTESASNSSDWDEMYASIATLLFSIGFLGVSNSPNDEASFVYSIRSVAKQELVRRSPLYQVHLAFDKALRLKAPSNRMAA